jgi:type III pantothenate kinase
MSDLLVDIGNTRAKWAVLRGGRLSPARAVVHGGKSSVMRAIVRAAPPDVDNVVAVCVAGSALERALAAAVRARFGVATRFVRSTRRAAGVRNGYRETWRLGADRWVAVIAAHALARGRAVLVANVGTALTLDAVTGEGRHIGGAIAPAPATMIASLLAGTHGIRRRARGSRAAGAARSRRLFAADTASALESGASYACAALIDRAVAEARKALGRRPLLLLTGGGAAQLRPHVFSPLRVVPDLVLRGLATLAKD